MPNGKWLHTIWRSSTGRHSEAEMKTVKFFSFTMCSTDHSTRAASKAPVISARKSFPQPSVNQLDLSTSKGEVPCLCEGEMLLKVEISVGGEKRLMLKSHTLRGCPAPCVGLSTCWSSPIVVVAIKSRANPDLLWMLKSPRSNNLWVLNTTSKMTFVSSGRETAGLWVWSRGELNKQNS